MIVAVAHNGSIIIDDLQGQRHLFTPEEAKTIGTAYYKWVQVRKTKGYVIEKW